ncbi:hypothetical protein [Sphingomonas sp. CCH5-D11]|jgi:hypothetical protein|uniref:hypothetical protein n=1 Tax=Sphingomonas sp. CCH5-D11 TaxID=1768786 RepID=UPI00082989C9|nr:hypothetical protein [Sphingomonas sp. CCH5-D11]
MGLIEERHPALGALIAMWRERQSDQRPPFASAMAASSLAGSAGIAVLLVAEREQGGLVIKDSGAEVDALYGATLAGSGASRLSPERDDAEREARSAIESGRPLLIEDELRGDHRRCRIARLYLPLTNDDGSPDGVLCGIVPVN